MRCVVPFFFGVDSLSSMRRFFFTMQGRLFYQKPYNETAQGAMNIYRPGARACVSLPAAERHLRGMFACN